MILWAERAAARAEHTTPAAARSLAGIVTVLALAAFVVAAVRWDIPLVPVL